MIFNIFKKRQFEAALPYSLDIKLDCTWVNMKNNYCKYNLLFPLIMANEGPDFYFFKDVIKIKKFDLAKEEVLISLTFGKEVRVISLNLKEHNTEIVPFDYLSDSKKNTTQRVGSIQITFFKEKFIYADLPGRIEIHSLTRNKENGDIISENHLTLPHFEKEMSSTSGDLKEGGPTFFFWLINERKDFVIVGVVNQKKNSYFPLRVGEVVSIEDGAVVDGLAQEDIITLEFIIQ